MIIQKQLSSLTEADLQILVSEEVQESETLEFKQEMYGQSDAEKREMLRDISCMANARGGHIFVGVRAERDQAVEIVGIDDASDAAARLLSSCLTGIQEKINGLDARPVPLANGRGVLAIFVPLSLRAPHMVTFKNDDRCWIRHGRQKLRMSVDELRDSCTRIDNLREKSDAFLRRHSTRWASRAEQHREVPLLRVATTPIPADRDRLSVRDKEIRRLMMVPPGMRSGFWAIEWPPPPTVLPSRDGMVIDLPAVQALEVFRSGHIEFRVYFSREGQYGVYKRDDGARLKYFNPLAVVEYTVSALRFYGSLAERVGILNPVVVSFQIINALGWGMLSERAYNAFVGRPTMESDLGRRWKEDRDLVVSEIQVPDLGGKDSVAQVCLDRVWNCFGYEKAPFFDSEGNFVPPAG